MKRKKIDIKKYETHFISNDRVIYDMLSIQLKGLLPIVESEIVSYLFNNIMKLFHLALVPYRKQSTCM